MRIIFYRPLGKQVFDAVFGKQRASEDSHHLIDISVQLEVMLDDSHQAVCCNGRINLYSDSILTIPPKGLDLQMLLYPFEEQLNLPSVFLTSAMRHPVRMRAC